MSKYFDETFGPDKSTVNAVSDTSWGPAKTTEENSAIAGGFASLPVTSSKGAVNVFRTLCSEFAEANASGAFHESYRELRTRLLRLRSERDLRSVAVTSSMKGEGKTLTSLNLAYSCAQLPELRVLLVDADIRSFGLSQLLNAPKGPGVSDILSNGGELESAILGTDLPNLHFLRGGASVTAPAELLASRRWSQLMDRCAQTYSLVIVDTPPLLGLTDADLITAPCDGVLMVVRLLLTRTDLLQNCAKQIDAKKFLGVVLNGAERSRNPYSYGVGAAKK